ncbi:MAG TPA: acyl carrier protein [Solirubrobacteraceae bacterium]|jgi:acyl carrier protein|nr:acyl carrier protein [Solirubrobacteraceae bacterium]
MTSHQHELHDVDGRGAASAADVAVVLACIAQILPEAPPPAITQDLIRSGVLDSLGLVELLFALEECTGRAIDLDAELDAADAERLSTVAGLAEHFFGTSEGAHA